MLRHRWKILTGSVLVFVVLTCIEVVTIGNEPKREVEAYKKSLIAKGEKLQISEVLPPPVPPEQNGADIVKEAFSLLSPEDEEVSNMVPAMRMIAPGKAIVCSDQPDLRDRYFTNSWANELAVVADDQPMTELLREAMNYPAMDFHLDYGQDVEKRMNDEIEYAGRLRRSAQRLSAAAMCDLHQGDAGSAATNICAILALVNHERESQFFITSVGSSFVAANANWELLEATNVNDQELAFLQTRWERLDYFRALENELEMERAINESEIAKLRAFDDYLNKTTRGYYRSVDWSDGLDEGLRDTLSNAKLACAKSMYRASWTYSDELTMLRDCQTVLETVRTISTNRFFDPAYSNMVGHLNAAATNLPDNWIAKFDDADFRQMFSEYSLGQFYVRAAMQNEATRRIVITAIALKRYQLKYGGFPVSLVDLVPQFVLSVPRDPIDGKPLRYRRMADGRFLLYSIGENGKDDGGDGSAPATTYGNFRFRWTSPEALDWVWPQPATPTEIQAFYMHPPGP